MVHKNLIVAFPEKSEKEIKTIETKFYKYLADTFIEYVIEMRISLKNLNKRFQYTNLDILDNYYEKGKDIILVMGHSVNWEWIFGMPKQTKYQVCIAYKKQSNPFFDEFLLKLRTRFGVDVVEMKSIIRSMHKNKKENVRSIYGLISDQRPPRSEAKYFTTFLNHQGTPIILGAERIAKSMDMAVFFFHVEKIKRGHYQATLVPLFDEVKDLPEYAITEAHVRALEKQIQENPQYWLWSHNRWKYTESDIKK